MTVKKLMFRVLEFARIPFITGILAGLLTGNISQGLITAGFAVIIWGRKRGINHIIIGTVFLQALTGNINFELVLLYFLTLAYIIDRNMVLRNFAPEFALTVTTSLSLLLFPFWSFLLSRIPAGFLQEINISGQFLFITALFLAFGRGFSLQQEGASSREQVSFLLTFLLAVPGIWGSPGIIPIWILGAVCLKYLEMRRFPAEVSVPVRPFYVLLILTSLAAGYFQLPFNIIFLGLFTFLLYIVYRLRRQLPLLEVVYLSVLLGIIAGRTGLLQ